MQWHLIVFYFKKIIFAKTKYSTHNHKLLTIIENFKQWKYYLKNIEFIVIVVSNHNNLKYFVTHFVEQTTNQMNFNVKK